VCGSGRADKTQVARMVTALLRLHDQPAADHTSDALAVAVCHLNRAPLQSRLAEALGRS
jgi:crossover junction endodeoxyribonuclease RuvC